MKKIAIVQPNYIPWIGYFQLINYVDEFIILDDVQYTKRDWRNRNCILSKNGLQWLTIPVHSKGIQKQLINEVKIVGNLWKKKHFESLNHIYSFKKNDVLYDTFKELYNSKYDKLLEVQMSFTVAILDMLNITTKLYLSSKLKASKGKNDRLIDLVKKVGGDIYVSGRKANYYLNENKFKAQGIDVEWVNYDFNFNYIQKHSNNFNPNVSIIDFILNNQTNFIQKFNEYKM